MSLSTSAAHINYSPKRTNLNQTQLLETTSMPNKEKCEAAISIIRVLEDKYVNEKIYCQALKKVVMDYYE